MPYIVQKTKFLNFLREQECSRMHTVCCSDHLRGCTPPGQTPPWPDTSPGQTPPADTLLDRHLPWPDNPMGRHLPCQTPPLAREPCPGRHPPWPKPPGQTPTPQADTLLPSACWDAHPLPSACWDTAPPPVDRQTPVKTLPFRN